MVLIEAISVVVRRSDIDAHYDGGWKQFEMDIPNPTLCTDGELARVGFMTPVDVEAYVQALEARGLGFRADGGTSNIVVVDQFRGLTAPCDWLQVQSVETGPGRVTACALTGSRLVGVATPKGWRYEDSLSRSSGYVPAEHFEKSLELLRRENGVDVYRSKLTGKKVYIARAGPAAAQPADSQTEEWGRIERLVSRALELDEEANRARNSRDAESGGRIYGELMEDLLPQAERLADGSVRNGSFANFAAGLVLRVLQRYDDAVARFKRSLAMQPDVVNTLLEITLCLANGGSKEEAERYAKQAVQIDPDSAPAWGNLAMCLIQLGRKEEARKAIDRALVLDPEDSKNQYIAGNFERYFS